MNQISKFVKSKGLINNIVVVLLIVPLYVTSVFSIFSYINLKNSPEPEIDTAILEDILSENAVEEDPFSQDEYQDQEFESDNMEVLPETGNYIVIDSVGASCIDGKIRVAIKYSSNIKTGTFQIKIPGISGEFKSPANNITISFKSDKTSFSVVVSNGSTKSQSKNFTVKECGSIRKPTSNNWLSISTKFIYTGAEEATYMEITCWTNEVTPIHKSNQYSITVKDLNTGKQGTKNLKPSTKDVVYQATVNSLHDFGIVSTVGHTYSIQCKDVTNNYVSKTVTIKGVDKSPAKSTPKPKPTNTAKPTPTKVVIKKPVTPTTYCNISGAQKVCTYVKIERYFVGIVPQYGYKVKVQMAPKPEYICDKYINTYKVSAGQLKSVRIYSNCK